MTSDPPVAIPWVDWNTISEEILCPLCDYNLRGLIEPRCPECGYRFEWRGLLDPKYRLHPYLFEHHPERNVRSFLRTALGGWRPRKFWQRLRPAHRLRAKRLILYWLICSSSLVIVPLVNLGFATRQTIRDNIMHQAWSRSWLMTPKGAGNAQLIRQGYGTVQTYLDLAYPTDPWRNLCIVLELRGCRDVTMFQRSRAWRDEALALAVVPFAWPWITLATLLIFQASMRREHIKSVHVLRCVLYSSDVLMSLGLAIPMAIALQMLTAPWTRGTILGAIGVFDLTTFLLILTATLVMAYRLAVAYRRYLKFDRPLLTVLASQMITLLLSLNLFWAPLLWR